MNKAVFIDRDGTINKEVNLLKKWKEFEFIEGVPEAIKKINQMGFLSIIITNQPVVAREMISKEYLEKIHENMIRELKNKNAIIDAIYYCPHHPEVYPEANNPALRRKCLCRKPSSGMINQASQDFNIDLKNSFVIGDTENDILAGKSAGCKTILVKSGHKIKKETEKQADFVCKDLKEAVEKIYSQQSKNI